MAMAMVAMFSTTLLVVLLLIIDSAPSNVDAAMVDIYHDIPGSDPIQVDCTKGNDQFAKRTLHYGQRFVWGFKPNFWGVTKYYCTFTWNPPQGNYNVRLRVWTDYKFFSHNPQRPCTRCVWRVARDGFYRMTSDSGEGPVYASGWICVVNCYYIDHSLGRSAGGSQTLEDLPKTCDSWSKQLSLLCSKQMHY